MARRRRRLDHQRAPPPARCAPTPTDLPYAMAKAGLNALTLGLAGAWAPEGAGQPRAARRVRHRHHRWRGGDAMEARRREPNPMRPHRPCLTTWCRPLPVPRLATPAGYVNGAQVLVDEGPVPVAVRSRLPDRGQVAAVKSMGKCSIERMPAVYTSVSPGARPSSRGCGGATHASRPVALGGPDASRGSDARRHRTPGGG